jgi:hypothetical protein
MTTEIPVHARERLKGLRSSAHSTGVFTSDFSVNEFLLVRKAGFAMCRQLRLSCRSTIRQLEQEPGARRTFQGDVPRA